MRRLPAVQVWDSIAQATGLFLEIPIRRSDKKVKYMGQILDPDDLNQPDNAPPLRFPHRRKPEQAHAKYHEDRSGDANQRRGPHRCVEQSIVIDYQGGGHLPRDH